MELGKTALSSASPGRERKILVIEDSPLQQRLLAEHLRAVGFAVRVEPDAAGALGALTESRPDAVLCDVVLPGLDGFVVCRTVRADPRLGDLPVVLVTSTEVDESDRLLARRAGASSLVARRPGYDGVVEALLVALDESSGDAPASEDGTFSDLRRRFLEEGSRETRERLQSMDGGADWATLQRTGHRWTGRGGALGYPAIAERAVALEAAAADRDAERVAAVLEALARLFDGAAAVRDSIVRPADRRPTGAIDPIGSAAPRASVRPRPEVVVADDDETVLAIVRSTLTNGGWRCHLALDGVEALALIDRVLPDAIVVDVNMPGRDGFEVLSAIRNGRRTRHIPVLLLTGRRQEIDVIRGFDLGAADYVVKPFNPLELAARLHRLVPADEER